MMQLDGRSDHWPDPQTDYEREALSFCRDWRSGRETFVLQTSGSTGTPKPIPLTRTQMQASARLTGQTLGLTPGDGALVCLNIRYVAGVMMLVRGLELGLRMTVVEPASDPLETLPPPIPPFDFTALVPLQLETLLSVPGRREVLNRMKAVIVGGAAVSPALEEALQAVQAPVYSTYGMTETVSHIALRRLNGSDRSDLFTALEGVELGVDDRSCLNIRSAATDFARIQTNDVVELREGGRFRLLGRADSIINSGGLKIQPEQVEAVLSPLLAPRRYVVVGLPDERLGEQVTLVLEAEKLPEALLAEVRHLVRSQMGPFFVPRQQRTLPVFPLTPTGKIDRKTIRTTLIP
ncbi:AMP-binding protein [Tellurirhabdus rosea]|uniref:AMP-binding protein n=1 Tax=Tellurirhabdus rosea TaxID=2674997 RepID=UPI00224CF495|nr:AMP-binding protein [Tellurirhabdus rosea]